MLDIENPAKLGSTRIMYLTFSEYSRPLHGRVLAGARTQTVDDDDRHFLDMSETCLYMVHFGLEPFFSEIAKIVYIGLL